MNNLPPEMAASESDDQLSAFLKSGIYRFDDAKASFIDPVRILNRSYTRFRVSASAYYSRFFLSQTSPSENQPENQKKRKRREKEKKKAQVLNPREQMADRRHQEVKLKLLKAHEALISSCRLTETLRNLREDGEKSTGESIWQGSELEFMELGSVWQAPFYEIALRAHEDGTTLENAGVDSRCQTVVPVFDNLIANEGSDDMEADFLEHAYILPKKSSFYMSDLKQINNLIPDESDRGFNLIVLDPPWENSSAHQKLKYPTLPNRYFLSLPIKELTHRVGALVAVWVTNSEKLRNFVENELFPKWGVKHAATFYWLKEINSEQLLRLKHIPDNQVFISVPGDYSRKPPIEDLLMDYVPSLHPARFIELFSREMRGGWTCWGNEPLHFQDSRYFIQTTDK